MFVSDIDAYSEMAAAVVFSAMRQLAGNLRPADRRRLAA